jgi:hypothetical protein
VNVNVTTTGDTATATSETTTTSSVSAQEVAPTPEVPPMIENDDNYEVVESPIGATVPYLPEEAEATTVNGKKYFIYDGSYYRPYSSDGDTVYMVVEDPTPQQM